MTRTFEFVPGSMIALIAILAAVAAGSASATVTVDHVGSPGLTNLLLGETFTVDVFVTWSGGANAAGLQGVSSSTAFDPTVLEFVGADWLGVGETAPSIFEGNPLPPLVLPGLSRSGGLKQPGDPDAILRTVSYASAPRRRPSRVNGGSSSRPSPSV